MSSKKIVLAGLLCFFSIFFGALLGALDFFGFLGGNHSLSLGLLAGSFVAIYSTLICLILLDFSDKKNIIYVFILASIFFGFTFFLVRLEILLALVLTAIYLVFLIYAYRSSTTRTAKFILFTPQEIVGPVLKKSLLVLVLMLSCVSFVQTQQRLRDNNLVTPAMLQFMVKPISQSLNTQFSSGLQKTVESSGVPELSPPQRQQIAELVVSETVKSMADGKTGLVYGIDPQNIPVDRTEVDSNNQINVEPVITAMLPEIADALNREINRYAVFAPLVVALLTILLLQPFLFIISGFELMLTIPLFKILFLSGFIKKTTVKQEVEKVNLD